MKTKSTATLLLTLHLAMLLGGCATAPLDTERSLIDSRIFRGKWFDYYNRGLRQLREGRPAEAEQDLRTAVRLRPEDAHRKRTYGVHFQRYYPHRELGILALQNGDYETAIDELSLSLEQASTPRAKHFLNESRRQWIRAEGLDQHSPRIECDGSLDAAPTNQRRWDIKGKASDDTYVSSVFINGDEQYIELAEPVIEFKSTVRLRPGKNRVRVSAVDLLGRSAEQDVEIELDVEAPTLALDDIRLDDDNETRKVWLDATAFDRNGIVECRIADQELPANTETLLIRRWFELGPSQPDLPIYLRDRCGNELHKTIDIEQEEGRWRVGCGEPPRRLLVASADPSIVVQLLLQAAAPGDPSIDLGVPSKKRMVYQDQFYINGTAYDRDGIKNITLNGYPMDILPGKNVCFGYLADLEPGTNLLQVCAADAGGRMATATLELTLKQPAARQLDQRLMVAMYDFVPNGDVPPLVRNALFPAFYSEMKKRQRFRVFERDKLDKILFEQQIAATLLTDRRYQSRLGEITAADLLLFGQVVDVSQGMEIYLDVVNRRQPDQAIPSVSVYLPGRDTARLDWAAKGLYLKLSDEFPLVEGKVRGMLKKDVLTDLGLEERVRTGTRLYVFRKMDHYVEGGEDLGPVEFDVGVLRVRKAIVKQSYSEVVDKSPEFQIQRGDYVITE